MNYYIVENRKMPWGDYGDILFQGLLTTMDENYNEIDTHLIERSGPYIPEIYEVNSTYMIIRDDIKDLLLKERIEGIEKFHNTEIKKLVEIDWQKWDLESEKPEVYPTDGEPYNLSLIHI